MFSFAHLLQLYVDRQSVVTFGAAVQKNFDI